MLKETYQLSQLNYSLLVPFVKEYSKLGVPFKLNMEEISKLSAHIAVSLSGSKGITVVEHIYLWLTVRAEKPWDIEKKR